jgi:ubiquinone biosynthesis protein
LDFGITGRLDEFRRLAFLRLVMGATMNDVRAQVEALRDLGALPADVDIDEVIVALGLAEAPQDIVEMSAEELTAQLRDFTKHLLSYGAKMPKELMLFVKNILFIDAAVMAFAPDIDLLGEIAAIAAYFASRYGGRIAEEIGVDPRERDVDLNGVRSSLGVSAETQRISYRELQARREDVRKKFNPPR